MWVWDAFQTLSGCRTYGGGMVPLPNPISFESIDAYARRASIEQWDEFSYLCSLIQRMDDVYKKHSIAEAKKAKRK